MMSKKIRILMGGSPCTHWTPVVEYENTYEVSVFGEVRRIKTGKILKPKIEKNGYVRIRLSQNGIAKSKLLHRIVAKAFIPNPLNHNTVNHKDEKKQNNKMDNLEWVSMSYQNSYGVGAICRNKFKEKPVNQYDLNGNFIKRWNSIKEVAESKGLNPSSIVCVCKGKRRYKSTGGYMFKYEEN